MRRIYCLAPNIEITHKIVDKLRAIGIEDRHIHIVTKRGTSLQDLPEASPLQRSNIIQAMKRAVAFGGMIGLLAGIVAFTGLILSGGAILASTLASAGIGVWVGGIVGLHVGNTPPPYEEAVEKGALLILLDIPKTRINEIAQMIIKHHPEAEIEGTEPTMPPCRKIRCSDSQNRGCVAHHTSS